MPLLCADYAQTRDCQDKELATLSVGRLYPAKAVFATVCDQQGADEHVIQRLAVFIRDSGYRKIVYKSDQEASIKLAFEQAFRLSCREGIYHNPHLERFVPENSAVGESQSKGNAENAVQRIEDMVRTYKAALEDRIGFRVPSTHAHQVDC